MTDTPYRKRILFVLPSTHIPGSHTHALDHVPFLESRGWEVGVFDCFLPQTRKPWMSYPRPIRAVFRLRHAVNRILKPWGYPIVFFYVVPYPALLTRLLRLAGKRIIYDLDDPLFMSAQGPDGKPLPPRLPGKVVFPILREVTQVVSFSPHLAQRLREINPNAGVLMNPVDASAYSPREKDSAADRPVRIGWVGTPHHLRNLGHIAPALRRIKERFGERVDLVYVCRESVNYLDMMRWIRFADEPEPEHFRSLDIGITPLVPDEYNRFKGSGKTLQYMSVGIPTVATRHGVNETMIKDGETGFLCKTDEEWYLTLTRLVENPDLRRRIGKNARDFVLQHHDVSVWRPWFERFLLGELPHVSVSSKEP